MEHQEAPAMADDLQTYLDAMRQAAEERLSEIGARDVAKTSDTEYCYDRGYHEGILSAINTIIKINRVVAMKIHESQTPEKDMKCAACRFWSRDKDDGKRAGSLRVQQCRKAAQWWNATEWTDEVDPECEWDNLRRVRPEYEGTKMFVQDGSDYYATLYTAADFGCIHFEKL